jgi:hypothetical protein
MPHQMHRQKQLELWYLEEARRASAFFPAGDFTPHENPDFLLSTAAGTLGIEVTELCCEAPRHEGARLGYVAPKAKTLYGRRAGAEPVSVSPVFSRDADAMTVDELAASLADFVYKHRDENGTFLWNRCENFPRGYSQIGVFEPFDFEREGHWRYFRAFQTTLAPKELLESRIAAKNKRLPDYRKVASEVWLLVVNDQFLGPGEVHVPGGQLVRWRFTFDFDRVLIFTRRASGAGQVVELRADSN